ncbi:MAG: molybdopterin-binding protein [Nitrospirae bacterium]|nr:molybdopterin-binding protein [Nitrospirota bacterium]
MRTVPVEKAVGMILVHDITEIRKDDFKGRAFRKGHVVTAEDVDHLQRLGKNQLFVLDIEDDEVHEDDAAYALAEALMGEGVVINDAPKEGKINIVASRDGLLKINKTALSAFNRCDDVICATLHDNTVVAGGRIVAGTRIIPLVTKREILNAAVAVAKQAAPVIRVKEMRRPKTGVVITGSEVYYGKIKDGFAPVITKKIASMNGEIIGICYAPDDVQFIVDRVRELLNAGADLVIVSGGMSVDPDDVTRFAVRNLGVVDYTYGAAVLPGSMFQIAYVKTEAGARQTGSDPENASPDFCSPESGVVPVIGIPACAMYHHTTVLDLVLPRILAGEHIGRPELAELGHGGLCLDCKQCSYPVCPFGK